MIPSHTLFPAPRGGTSTLPHVPLAPWVRLPLHPAHHRLPGLGWPGALGDIVPLLRWPRAFARGHNKVAMGCGPVGCRCSGELSEQKRRSGRGKGFTLQRTRFSAQRCRKPARPRQGYAPRSAPRSLAARASESVLPGDCLSGPGCVDPAGIQLRSRCQPLV